MNLIEFLNARGIAISDVGNNINNALLLRDYIDLDTKPKKPSLPKNPTSDDYANMAVAMKKYEEELATYNEIAAAYRTHNQTIENMVDEYMKMESGLDELKVSDMVKKKIFSKAYSDGHSGGHIEVYYHLLKLVEMLID